MRLVVVNHGWESQPIDGRKGGRGSKSLLFLSLSIYLPAYLPIHFLVYYQLSIYLSIYLPTRIYLSIHLTILLSFHLPTIHLPLSIYPPIYLSACLSSYPSTYLPIHPSTYLSTHPSIHLSDHSSTYLFVSKFLHPKPCLV